MELFLNLRFGIKLIEALACITGFVVWARLYPRYWRLFPLYLLIITCCEFAGWYMYRHSMGKEAKLMYSYFVVPFEFLYMYYLFYKNLVPAFSKIVFVVSIIYVIALLSENIFLQDKSWIWLSVSYSIGCACLFILITIYFLQLSNSSAITRYREEPFFWACMGLSIFYVGTFPFYAMPTGLAAKNLSLYMLLSWLVVIFNYAMYAFFIKGFLCHKRILK